MVWAMFSWTTLGTIIPIHQSLTSMHYVNIIADQVYPFMTTVFPAGDGVYQKDIIRHKRQIVMEWFDEHSGDYNLCLGLQIHLILIQWSICGPFPGKPNLRCYATLSQLAGIAGPLEELLISDTSDYL